MVRLTTTIPVTKNDNPAVQSGNCFEVNFWIIHITKCVMNKIANKLILITKVFSPKFNCKKTESIITRYNSNKNKQRITMT